MIVRTIVLMLALLCALSHAEDPKPAPKPKGDAATEIANREWLEAVERLRVLPLPGELKNTGLQADLGDVFELSDAAKGDIKKLQSEYNAELLKRAAKWAEEEKALRAEYEAKVLQSVPEARREAAKKALEASHAAWRPPLERDNEFKKEYENRVAELQENRAKLSIDELNDARKEMHAWVGKQKDKYARGDEQNIAKIKANLSPEEAERLQKLVHLRVPEPEAPPKEPVVDPKEPKKEKKKKQDK